MQLRFVYSLTQQFLKHHFNLTVLSQTKILTWEDSAAGKGWWYTTYLIDPYSLAVEELWILVWANQNF